jgi:Holliday junction resolvasome RuvABC DNA-binding subunit
MYSYLIGEITEIGIDYVVCEVNGIGIFFISPIQ